MGDTPIDKAAKAIGHAAGTVAKAVGAIEGAVEKRLDKFGNAVVDGVRHLEERLGAPHLLRRDDAGRSPAQFTLYLRIGRGGFSQSKTGVYVPEKLSPRGKVNLILYLHGNKLRVVNAKDTIEEIWGKDAGEKTGKLVFPLREDLNESGKQFILIAPTLGAQDQGIGEIGTNLDFYLEQVMLALVAYGGFPDLPVGDIIIAGHSGAGGRMLALASGTNSYKNNIKEIWGFDTLLKGTEGDWRSWAVGHSSQTKVYVYYWAYGDASLLLAKDTAGVDSVYVMKADSKAIAKADSGEPHDFILKRHWRERLDNIGSPSQSDIKGREESRAEAKKRN